MNLYLVEVGEDHLHYEPINCELHLYKLNKKLKGIGTYPILNSNDHRLIMECGGTVLKASNDKKTMMWILNLDHVKSEFHLESVEFREMVSHIILSVKRDLKLKFIYSLS
jgi:hypothetical protein